MKVVALADRDWEVQSEGRRYPWCCQRGSKRPRKKVGRHAVGVGDVSFAYERGKGENTRVIGKLERIDEGRLYCADSMGNIRNAGEVDGREHIGEGLGG